MIFVKKEGNKIVNGEEVPIVAEGRPVTRSKFRCWVVVGGSRA